MSKIITLDQALGDLSLDGLPLAGATPEGLAVAGIAAAEPSTAKSATAALASIAPTSAQAPSPHPRIFDLHCDTLDALAMQGVKPFLSQCSSKGLVDSDDLQSNPLQLSLKRMMAAGQWCQCFAVWVPDDLSATGLSPHAFYDRVSAYFREQVQKHPKSVRQVFDGTQIEQTAGTKGSQTQPVPDSRVAALLTVENASPLSEGIQVLDQMASDGVKMITLTWNGPNCVGSGNQTLDGLTTFGKQVVSRMEQLHMVVDVSHLNDAGFKDVLSCSTRPFVASHSNSRAVCGHPRNLTDFQFKAIAERGGLVGINYYRSFITDAAGTDDATFDDLSFHINHFLHLGGEKTIALGSDFDGSDTPRWLLGAQDVPAFREKVAERFGEDIAEAMFWGNAAAFFAQNEAD